MPTVLTVRFGLLSVSFLQSWLGITNTAITMTSFKTLTNFSKFLTLKNFLI